MKKILIISLALTFSTMSIVGIVLQLSEEQIYKSNGPVTLQKFDSLSIFKIQMPKSVKNIEYSYRDAGTQDHEIYLKYSLNKDEIDSFLIDFNNEYRRIGFFPRSCFIKRTINFVKKPMIGEIWWKEIKHISGYYYALETDYKLGPQIWVDTVNSKLYYYDFF